MELLQRKMNLLQNSNEQNSKALKEILEIEMNERLRYPKYTIIQNTPLTPHEEIMNEIIQKKLGPGNSYSMNYPTVIFKNQEEINEMRNLNNNNNTTNNNINNTNNFNNNNRVGFQSNDMKPVTVKMIKEIQKEVLSLRKTVNDLKIQVKQMKENFKMDLEKDINSNKLLVEVIRKVIEDGGDNKLKNCVEKYFDNKKINLDEIKTDLEIFKTEELNGIINDQINKYDEKLNRIIERMQNDLLKIKENKNSLNNNINNNMNLFEEKSKKSSSKNSKKIVEKIMSEGSKKSNKLNLNNKDIEEKIDEKNSEDNKEEEEDEDEEEDDDEDISDMKKKGNKSKKSHSDKSKNKKSSNKKSSKKS